MNGLYRAGRERIGGKVCWLMQMKRESESLERREKWERGGDGLVLTLFFSFTFSSNLEKPNKPIKERQVSNWLFFNLFFI